MCLTHSSSQTPSPLHWYVAVCWAVPGSLRAQPPACPGEEPTIALLTGSTSTSRAAALTCWPRPLMAPGLSTLAQCVMGEETAARYQLVAVTAINTHYQEHHGASLGASERKNWKHLLIVCACVCVCCSDVQGLRMMLGLDLVSVHNRNLTLNNLPVPNGEPLFQNGKLIPSVSKVLFYCHIVKKHNKSSGCVISLYLVGVSVHWLGDFVFVESGLGVRLKFDLVNTVYLTVTIEHLAATRGLCGVYNNNPDGERICTDLITFFNPSPHFRLM